METFESKLSPEEVLSRIKENTDSGLFHFGYKFIHASLHGTQFKLQVEGYRYGGMPANSFVGNVQRTGTGSRITGEFKVPAAGHYFLYFLTFFEISFFAFLVFMFFKYREFSWPFLFLVFFLLLLLFFGAKLLVKQADVNIQHYPYVNEFINYCAGNVTELPRFVSGGTRTGFGVKYLYFLGGSLLIFWSLWFSVKDLLFLKIAKSTVGIIEKSEKIKLRRQEAYWEMKVRFLPDSSAKAISVYFKSSVPPDEDKMIEFLYDPAHPEVLREKGYTGGDWWGRVFCFLWGLVFIYGGLKGFKSNSKNTRIGYS